MWGTPDLQMRQYLGLWLLRKYCGAIAATELASASQVLADRASNVIAKRHQPSVTSCVTLVASCLAQPS